MDCAIRTDDAMVSRHHARIFWGGGGYVLEDLSSANGVYFQEQRVQSHLFKHGDAVRCGSLWLRFVCSMPGVSEPPQGESEEARGQRMDWINGTVQAFCQSRQARRRVESAIQKEAS